MKKACKAAQWHKISAEEGELVCVDMGSCLVASAYVHKGQQEPFLDLLAHAFQGAAPAVPIFIAGDFNTQAGEAQHTFLDFIHNALEEFGVRFLLDGMAKDASIMFYRIARRAARISAMKKRQFQITRCSQETLRFLWSVLRYGSLLPLCGMRGP